MWPPTVRSGASVVAAAALATGAEPRVDVCPSMMMAESSALPEGEAGSEKVVPDIVTAGPPGESVVPGARTKAPLG